MKFFNNFRNVRLAQNPSIDNKQEPKLFDKVMARANEIKNDSSIPESEKANIFKREFSQDYNRLTPYHQEKVMSLFGSASFQQTPPNTPDGVYNAAKEKTNKLYPYLAKIKNGNDFLYLAATKTPGFSGDSFYTESNRGKLTEQLNRIANEPYIQRNYPNIPPLLESAIKKLDEKISGKGGGVSNNKTEAGNPARPNLEPVTFGNFPSAGEQVFEITSPDAKIVIQLIDNLDKLFEQNPQAYKKQFKDLFKVIVDTYNEKKNSILIEEGSEIKRRLEQAKINYQKVFNPEGFTSAGNSYFVVDYNVAARDIIGQLKSSNDRKEINRLLDLFQQQFLNKYPKNTDITQYLRPINIAINKWNFANRDRQEPLALLTLFKP
jgi:hypothetical protein